MDRIQKSMTAYVKAMSKRNEGEDKEKTLAVAHLGGTMVNLGEQYGHNSEFSQCLTSGCPAYVASMVGGVLMVIR